MHGYNQQGKSSKPKTIKMGDVPSKEDKRGNMGHKNQVSQAEVQRLRDQVNRLQREQQRLQQSAQQNQGKQQAGAVTLSQQQWSQVQHLLPVLESLSHQQNPASHITQSQMQQYQALRPHLEAMQRGSTPQVPPPFLSRTTVHTDVIHQSTNIPMNTGAVPRRGAPRGRGHAAPQAQNLFQQPPSEFRQQESIPARGGPRGRAFQQHQQPAGGRSRRGAGEWRQGQPRRGSGGEQQESSGDQQQGGRGRGNRGARGGGGRGGNRGMRAGKSMDSLQFAGKEQPAGKDFVDTILKTPNNTPDTSDNSYSLAKLEQALSAFAVEGGRQGIGLEQLTRALQNLTENAPDKQTPEKAACKQQKKLNNAQAAAESENKAKPKGKSVNTVKNNLLEGFDLLEEISNPYFYQKVTEAVSRSADEDVEPPFEDAGKLRDLFLEVPQDEVRRSLPQHWVLRSFPMLTQHVTPELDPNSMDFVELTNAFKKTAPTLSVKCITRLENAFLWREFCERKRRLTQALGGEPEERQLYHGPRDLKAVLESGFGWTYQHRPRPRKYNHRIALTSYAANACQHCRDTHKVVVAVSLQGSRAPSAMLDLLTGEPETSTDAKDVLRLLDDYSSYPAYIIEWEGDLPPPGPKQQVKQKQNVDGCGKMQ